MSDCSAKLQQLDSQLLGMRARAEQHFDPLRFAYALRLYHKAQAQSGRTAESLYDLAAGAVQAYCSEVQQTKAKATALARQLAAAFPQLEAQLLPLELRGDLRALQQMQQRILREQTSALALLTEQIEARADELEQQQRSPTLNDMLRRQERDMVKSLSSDRARRGDGTGDQFSSLRRFRESLAKLNVEKMVAQAIQDSPQDSGPLNPQMLVTRTVASMRELSPHYLHRFIAYVDTLLWLEQASERESGDGKNNAKRSKNKTKTKVSATPQKPRPRKPRKPRAAISPVTSDGD